MQKEPLFHAYIVGGARADARAHLAELFSAYKITTIGNADFAESAYVSFSVDDARALRAWQELMPGGERKISVVYTDFINTEAQNALLKTFEEPFPNTHIFLVVPNPDILLPTLLSRVRVMFPSGKNSAEFLPDPTSLSFLSMKVGERMSFIQRLADKSEDDDASALVREKAILFLNDLEFLFAKDRIKNQKKLEEIIRFKKYLYMSGSSVKMILETIALTI
jgi:hypothetical protein